MNLLFALILLLFTEGVIALEPLRIAYIGRQEGTDYDRVTNKFLTRLASRVSAKNIPAGIVIDSYYNNSSPTESAAIYQKITADNRHILVVDSTWGAHVRAAADTIRARKIPVITLNADRSGINYDKRVVFLGHDDNTPSDVVKIIKDSVDHDVLIYISETDYVLSKKFELEAKQKDVNIDYRFTVSNSKFNDIEMLDLKKQIQDVLGNGDYEKPLIMINTHRFWGVPIIGFINESLSGVTSIGGAYVLGAVERDGVVEFKRGNRFLVLTHPADTLPKYIAEEYFWLKENQAAAVKELVNLPLFIKRLYNSFSIIQSAVSAAQQKVDYKDQPRKEIRTALLNIFTSISSSGRFISERDELKFSPNLDLKKDVVISELNEIGSRAYGRQFDDYGELVNSVRFGFDYDSIRAGEIDLNNNTFFAEFLFWLEYDSSLQERTDKKFKFEDIFHFSNRRGEESLRHIATLEENDRISMIYKVSGTFNGNFQVNNFPRDQQELAVGIEIRNPNENRYRLAFDPGQFDYASFSGRGAQINGWNILRFYTTVDNEIARAYGGSRSGGSFENVQEIEGLNLRILVERKIIGPLVTLLLPLSMMALASVSILFTGDTRFSTIGETVVVIFLSVVTYSVAFSDFKPDTNFLTKADYIFYATFILVLFIFLFIIFLNTLVGERIKTLYGNVVSYGVGISSLLVYWSIIVFIMGVDFTVER